nr:TniB family NTP-binding protein [Xanthobacter dioxanivorans]
MDAERIAWIRADRWLDLDQARAALGRLEDLLAYPPRDRMPCLLLYGDTGMGKTKIIRKFLRDHSACFDQGTGMTTMPVVAMQMPAEPIERDIYSELLTVLGAPGPADGTTHRQKDLCRRLLRSMGARMLIIDEIHAMLAGSFRQQRVFLNAIRFLANDLRIPLVCAGTDLVRQALLTDPQLAERFEAFHLQHGKNDARLAQLLASLATILPLRRPSNLAAPATETPCRCNSRIIISSPSRTIAASSHGGHGADGSSVHSAGASPGGMNREEGQSGNFQGPLSGRIAGPMTASPWTASRPRNWCCHSSR